jgi:MFS family permease
LSILISPKGIRLAQAFQSRAFAWFWLGQTISALGDGAFATALAVAVYELTGSSLAMGLFLMAQIIPELIFTLLGGLAADRFPRRLILFCSDVGRALVVFLIALLALLNLLQLWHLFVLAVLFGIISSFFHPSYRAITPELVAKEHLSSANALTELSVQCGNLLGPMLGASLIVLGRGSAGMAFAFDGLTFGISVCSLVAIRSMPKISQGKTGESETSQEKIDKQQEREMHISGLRSVGHDLREGFHTIVHSTWLLWSMIVAAFGLMAYRGALSVSLPKLVFAVFENGPWLLAAITTTVGIGAIAGAIFVGQAKLRRRGIIALFGYILSGLALLAFALPLPHAIIPFVVLPAAFFVGFGINVMQIIWVTLLYELVPGDKLGRVSSVDLLGSLGLLPVGYVLAGWIGDRLGPSTVFLLAGVVMVVLNVIPLFLRDIRALE